MLEYVDMTLLVELLAVSVILATMLMIAHVLHLLQVVLLYLERFLVDLFLEHSVLLHIPSLLTEANLLLHQLHLLHQLKDFVSFL
jgi:hypothetical protein